MGNLKTIYVSLSEINELQTSIMKFVQYWVHEKNTPIPYKEIVLKMKSERDKDEPTVASALNVLLKKGYLRRAWTNSNKTFYVQLRRV